MEMVQVVCTVSGAVGSGAGVDSLDTSGAGVGVGAGVDAGSMDADGAGMGAGVTSGVSDPPPQPLSSSAAISTRHKSRAIPFSVLIISPYRVIARAMAARTSSISSFTDTIMASGAVMRYRLDCPFSARRTAARA